MPQSFKKRQNNARISSERNYTTVAADQPKLGTFVGCISQEMSFSMSSILAPNVGTNPVPVPSTTQSLNPVLGPSQWSWSNCQPVSLAPANPHSAHQPQLSQGMFLMPAVPQAQGVAYQPGSYTPASGTPFLRLTCCNLQKALQPFCKILEVPLRPQLG